MLVDFDLDRMPRPAVLPLFNLKTGVVLLISLSLSLSLSLPPNVFAGSRDFTADNYRRSLVRVSEVA